MKREIAAFVSRFMTYQLVEAKHQKPSGLLQLLEIPEWKWENLTMDFVSGLPRTSRGNNAIWIIMDRLTKSAQFLPMKTGKKIHMLPLRGYLLMRLSVVMDSQFLSHPTETVDSSRGSRRHYMNPWV